MRVAVLTSSRADYGIYRPLLKAFKADAYFDLSVIAFGSHLSKYHGYTIQNILEDGFNVDYTVSSLLLTDDENAISTAIGLTTIKFAEFWQAHAGDFDIVFCLGDRFEMFAAVMAGLSYGVPFAHLHGGEITLGAIDNVFRHSISMAAKLHFVSTQAFADKISALRDDYTGQSDNIIVSGALSLDNLREIEFLNDAEFLKKWQIDLSIPTILITIHPETVEPEKNKLYLQEVLPVLTELKKQYQLVITMPNVDTNGIIYREAFIDFGGRYPDRVKLIENFGTQSYFTCMQRVDFMLGNTSSGIIEAASFNKFVINVGDRQKGRLAGSNVIQCPFNKEQILKAVADIKNASPRQFENIYYNGGATEKIVNKLKSIEYR
ncbi:UDP-N-acetylglucosamine 2-epimerase [Mucilaginibacter sp.]|uniref:UDP-N-acetylglucosamine 2-epimerase n=1 Tax=Mucilaginibacter sp. TaxID=1882438 RepID=UPI0025F7FDA3|nr:UDP-N-acetylglucosamine 2-epimerase [Mucilaginibacter sp.]